MITRLEAYNKALGWVNRPIEDIAAYTGCEAVELLDSYPADDSQSGPYGLGWHSKNKSLEVRMADIFPCNRGNLDFWLGVAHGIMIRDC